jgi:hypothetical protein
LFLQKREREFLSKEEKRKKKEKGAAGAKKRKKEKHLIKAFVGTPVSVVADSNAPCV